MTDAIAGIGVQLQIGDGADPVSYTNIAEVKDVSGPSLSQDTEDVTSHGSPGNWEEHIPTILRSGEVTFTINYVPTDSTHDSTDGLLSDLEAQTAARKFRVIWPDQPGTQWDFTAIVTNFEPSGPVDGAFEAEVTLKLTGQPTLA